MLYKPVLPLLLVFLAAAAGAATGHFTTPFPALPPAANGIVPKRLPLCSPGPFILNFPDLVTAPPQVSQYGLLPTFNTQVDPHPCPFDASLTCGLAQKFYPICAGPADFVPSADSPQLDVAGISAADLTDPSFPLPFLPVYLCDCDTSGGGAGVPLVSDGLGGEEMGLAYWHHLQTLASNPYIRAFGFIPEVANRDPIDVDTNRSPSVQRLLQTRVLTKRGARQYVIDRSNDPHDAWYGLVNPDLIVNLGHSYDGEAVVEDLVGDQFDAQNIQPFSGPGKIALSIPLDGTIQGLTTQQLVGGAVPYNFPTLQLVSQNIATNQGTMRLWARNKDYGRNLWIMPTNSSHEHFAPGDLRLAFVLLHLNATTFHGNVTFNYGYPPRGIFAANGTELYTATLATTLTYLEAGVGGWVLQNPYYANMLTHDALLQAQKSCQPSSASSLSFQFFDKPGGCTYLTLSEVLAGTEKLDNYYGDSSYTPSVVESIAINSQSQYIEADPGALVFLNGLRTNGIIQPTPQQYDQLSWDEPRFVGPCSP